LINVEGGFKAIEKAGVKMTDYVCPTSMLWWLILVVWFFG
jgi:hypothetical protein